MVVDWLTTELGSDNQKQQGGGGLFGDWLAIS